jgi:hypothetical protein
VAAKAVAKRKSAKRKIISLAAINSSENQWRRKRQPGEKISGSSVTSNNQPQLAMAMA